MEKQLPDIPQPVKPSWYATPVATWPAQHVADRPQERVLHDCAPDTVHGFWLYNSADQNIVLIWCILTNLTNISEFFKVKINFIIDTSALSTTSHAWASQALCSGTGSVLTALVHYKQLAKLFNCYWRTSSYMSQHGSLGGAEVAPAVKVQE